jgi:hypothetical protein
MPVVKQKELIKLAPIGVRLVPAAKAALEKAARDDERKRLCDAKVLK